MLSRTSSNAGTRLHRAQSTSSHHTATSGHHRTSTSTDPFAAKQQAEVAAVEAYNRSRHLDDQAQRPTRRLERRRSNTTGRIEGSHFEDARLGRRKSTSTRSDSKAPQPRRSQPPTVVERAEDPTGEDRIITRKRSVIPPSSTAAQSQRSYSVVPSTTSHHARKSQSVYADGSPAPRRAAPLAQRSSTLQLDSTPIHEHSDGYGGNLAHIANFAEPATSASNSRSYRKSTRETQTDEEILALARDKCLQDFQQKKVRERKSFILAPFQKRRATNSVPSGDGNYDTSLPPFNYADDVSQAPFQPASEPFPIVPVIVTKAEKKARKVSDTLTGRIKKVFRKASRAPSGLPLQQVEAKHFHYETGNQATPQRAVAQHFSYPSEEAPLSVPAQAADPFVVSVEETPIATTEQKSASANSRSSHGQCSETQSRVTSWTNSTIAGTCTSRMGLDQLIAVEENGGLQRSSSISTLRKAKSFFGGSMQSKLRCASKAELNASDESQGLYSALQERIKPTKRTPTPDSVLADEGAGSRRSRLPSGLASLPSQRPASSTVSSNARYSTPTVRSVSPTSKIYKQRICSPVEEVLNPEAANVAQPDAHEQTLLQRRRATKAPAPSQEQLQRRMERCKNRWQSALDELSPHPARAYIDENPYELRSLSQTHQQPQTKNDLPHHAMVGEQPPFAARADMLSPSVYSRATDGASPRLYSPAEQPGTVVTITGREIRSYSISPPKEEPAPRPAQTSGQWRRWLSDEMHGIKSAQEDFNLAQVFLGGYAAMQSRAFSGQNGSNEIEARHTSVSLLPDARPASATARDRPHSAATGRPRASSRKSSFMNDRFPMIDTSRNSSGTSITSRNMYNRTASGSDQEQAVRPTVDTQKHSFTRPRVLTGRASITQMHSAPKVKTAQSSLVQSQDIRLSGALPAGDEPATAACAKDPVPSEHKTKRANRHKSAFELRVNYKNTSTGRTTPLEIRRKTVNETNKINNMLEDTTIRNISAGPYASHNLPTAALGATSVRESNKENTPPAESPGLPALSSSEWLAAGPNKSRKPSAVHPAYRNRAPSRHSPPKASTAYQADRGGGNGSPAQRMASQWLEKRSRESTPAFM